MKRRPWDKCVNKQFGIGLISLFKEPWDIFYITDSQRRAHDGNNNERENRVVNCIIFKPYFIFPSCFFLCHIALSYIVEDSETSFPTLNNRDSSKCGAISCSPKGSFLPSRSTTPQGTESAGIPIRFAGTVKTSARYMASGSLLFSPILNAGVGVVGVAITSTSLNACSKSLPIKLRRLHALL